MSPSSGESSQSWTGGGGGGGAMVGRGAPDIIDLDRYMRGHVRGANRHTNNNNSSRLVVDAGGCAPRQGVTKDLEVDTSSSGSRDKRYSHDSGLSDGSYTKRRRPPRRRVSAAARSQDCGPKSSIRNFRTHTERALKEQQEQIARVAQICERLTVRGGGGGAGRGAAGGGGGGGSDTPDSSDISTTTSGGDRLKDVRECKTYKIIMSKLDELSHLFATRARAPVVAKEAPTTHSANTSTLATTKTLMERAVGSDLTAAPPPPSPPPLLPAAPPLATTGAPIPTHGSVYKYNTTAPHVQAPPAVAPPLSRLTPALALQVDIAPETKHAQTRDVKRQSRHKNRTTIHSGTLNVATESVLHYSSPSGSVSGDSNSAGTSAGHYHLQDPLKLYAQAKRLQALQAQSRRARSAESSYLTADRQRHIAETVIYNTQPSARDRLRGGGSAESGSSVCARCRRYWRALTRCLLALHTVS